MIRWVVDASVGAKWLLPESGWSRARSLIGGGIEKVVPDFFFAEVASAVQRKLGRGEVTVEQAMEAITELRRAPVTAVPVRPYVLGGFRIAHEIGETVYDAFYLAVAEAHECRVVTADHELMEAVAGTSWEGRVVALEDLPAG